MTAPKINASYMLAKAMEQLKEYNINEQSHKLSSKEQRIADDYHNWCWVTKTLINNAKGV